MINLYSAHINTLSIHHVGNKSHNEPIFLSNEPYKADDELTPLLKEYFLKPFREKEENYFKFIHETDLEFHELFNLASEIFDNPESTHEVGKKITKHLYDQSLNTHIKSGEVYIVHFEHLQIDNEKVEGIGIFKSEIKQDFLQFSKEENQFDAHHLQGVNLNKLAVSLDCPLSSFPSISLLTSRLSFWAFASSLKCASGSRPSSSRI